VKEEDVLDAELLLGGVIEDGSSEHKTQHVPPKADRLDVAGGAYPRYVRAWEQGIHRQSNSVMEEIAPAVYTAVLCIA
jgi:hypothetical protein